MSVLLRHIRALRRHSPLLALLVAFPAIPALASSYHFAAVWDGEHRLTNVCISVEKDRIESVGACPAAAVDLSRYTAIPGLIDMHTHMTYVWKSPVTPPGRNAAVVYLARENALRTLETGVTTARDLGSQ